jgi:hypothetical protein
VYALVRVANNPLSYFSSLITSPVMPSQLMSLNEQLLNLKIVYEHAVFSGMPLEDIKKIKGQIEAIEIAIAERKEYVKRLQSPN